MSERDEKTLALKIYVYDIYIITDKPLIDCTRYILPNKCRNVPKSYLPSQLNSLSVTWPACPKAASAYTRTII